MWILFAFGSALFAGLTAILAKCGIRKTDSTVATALRAIVVLAFSWLMVFVVGSQSTLRDISGKTLLFLTLSGLATGASWLCYYKALRDGPPASWSPSTSSASSSPWPSPTWSSTRSSRKSPPWASRPSWRAPSSCSSDPGIASRPALLGGAFFRLRAKKRPSGGTKVPPLGHRKGGKWVRSRVGTGRSRSGPGRRCCWGRRSSR